MRGRMILYRGSLKSCNYDCSYCPFSKHTATERELVKDREQWLSFVEVFHVHAKAAGIRALMVVPYGEALVHPWYWEGLARLSAQPWMDAVGAQTNLSFPAAKSAAAFVNAGGVPQKLRLWATFHPEMTTIPRFAGAVRELLEAGVVVCAGAVAVPAHLGLLRELARSLPEDVYFWLNRMDGLARPYTEEEKRAFQEIDPYFIREVTRTASDAARCAGRIFAEGDGRLRACNIGPALDFRLESIPEERKTPPCRKKYCSCYLAYGGREDFLNQALFGPYPLFRIPRRPKAAFFDIEGTLTEGGGKGGRKKERRHVFAEAVVGLKALSAGKTALFFATTLPYAEALSCCREVWHLFRGGVFAGGAHIVLKEQEKRREYFSFLKESCVLECRRNREKFRYRILTERNGGKPYKITLLRPSKAPWGSAEAGALFDALPNREREEARYFVEGNCLQIVAAEACKANGIRMLCQWTGLSVSEVFAAGDSVDGEDEEMVRLWGCRNGCGVSAGDGGSGSAGF